MFTLHGTNYGGLDLRLFIIFLDNAVDQSDLHCLSTSVVLFTPLMLPLIYLLFMEIT